MVARDPQLSELLAILACPACCRPLEIAAPRLACSGCGRTFGFEGHVPVLLTGGDGPDDRRSLGGRLHRATLGNPRFYDVMQRRLGGSEIAARVAGELHGVAGEDTLLDIGAGTGMVAGLTPAGARYVWLDNDVLKLRGFLARSTPGEAVLGDAGQLPVADGAVNWTVMVAVSHHVPDDVLDTCLREAARVTRDRFLFVDAVRGRRIRSRLLWQLDRGRFPRTEGELLEAIAKRFEVTKIERFREIHDYLLCAAAPRHTPATGTHA